MTRQVTDEDMARFAALDLVQEASLSSEATRRLGFVAEKLAQNQSLDDATRHRLRDFAADLHEPSMSEGPALTFSAAVTDTYLEKLRGETDETSQRWQVFAKLD